eukprot:COSAG02_NODE_8662_length_2487_cov_5.805276_1_plen_276_part_00
MTFLSLLLINISQPGTAEALRFSDPQLLGPGGVPCYFNGFDTGNGTFKGRLVAGSIGPGDAIASLGGEAGWALQHGANSSALGEMYPFPSECRDCRSMETLGILDGLTQLTGTAMNASGGYLLSVKGGRLVTTPSGIVRRFQGLPPLKRDSTFSAGGMRWSGTASVRRPNGTLLQTGIVTFAGQPMRNDGTRRGPNATSVVLFRSDDGIIWDYVTTIASARDYPESWEGPNEMDLATLDDDTLIVVMRMDGGDADGSKWAKSNNHSHDLERDFNQ